VREGVAVYSSLAWSKRIRIIHFTSCSPTLLNS
jgi:hypothetical protein